MIELKLSGLAFGMFVPIFFVVSGMQLVFDALTQDVGTMLRVPVFLALFLVVRGLPTLWSHRTGPRTATTASPPRSSCRPCPRSSSPSRRSDWRVVT